jgi:hypothetical protein
MRASQRSGPHCLINVRPGSLPSNRPSRAQLQPEREASAHRGFAFLVRAASHPPGGLPSERAAAQGIRSVYLARMIGDLRAAFPDATFAGFTWGRWRCVPERFEPSVCQRQQRSSPATSVFSPQRLPRGSALIEVAAAK